MATSNVASLELAASLALPSKSFDGPNASGDVKTANVTEAGEQDDSFAEKPKDVENVDETQPAGLRQMQAITMTWSKKWLITAYCLIWLISFTNSLQQQSNFSWTPYVTSEFLFHGLTGITGIVANLIGGVSKLPLAKFIDLVGRPHGFFICLVCVVLALVMMGVCQNVQTYAAAQVFYWTGMNGMDYVLDIFIADTSDLRNRAIWLAFATSPYIVNTFAGPRLGQRFLDDSTWRWGYGAFTIITPFMCIPFWLIFYIMSRRAKQQGVVAKEKSGRTFVESVKYYFIEFDVIGLLLICGGFSIFLLPFSLAAYQADGWRSPTIICMIVFGLVLLALFAAWERFWAPKTFFPFHLLTDRSVIAACLLGANSWIAFYSYKMYYASYLQVVFGLSVAKAGYITNIFNIVSCAWGVLFAFAIRHTDRYKWAAVAALPVQILMTGLMVHFRQPGTRIALLVLVEVLGAMCGAMMVAVEQLAVMAAVPHENVAVGLALLAMVTSIGGSVGQTVSAAIWTQTVPRKIAEYLPEELKGQAPALYASLVTQLAAPWESAERQAVVRAYGDAQRLMIIVGTCALVPCIVWVAMLNDYKLSERGTRKGLIM
ncbi:major facilitator superfamily domain-containing protein [Boeremia exigua]|uniref:major facilitator superfamily domain-containing protein n=1 Tax=Boeremia exigua TaxID=749465 RepID=UPI001E8CCC16|nr:major facilitator superfamily domain-containing protein [Boeremia exigua]KAH6639773.1 major facilitator superfamily domain-containing protein [Boeremia exigua]